MPKFVACPTCKSDVKVPRDAEPGTVLTCSACAEEFTPKFLRKKDYDPREEEGYDVREPAEVQDREKAERKRKAKAIMRSGRQTERDRTTYKPPPFFGGFELILLGIAAVSAFAAIVGFIVAKRAPNTGEAILIIVGFCGLMFIFGWRKLIAGRERLGG
jgi:hypothetical protein